MNTLAKSIASGALLFSCCLPGVAADNAAVSPARLRCEFREEPLGVDIAHPRLSWQLDARAAGVRGLRQSAYQILVAGTPEKLAKETGDLWDSGRVESGQTMLVPYGGKPLVSSQQVFWAVRVWDDAGRVSPWSRPASWTMGVLKDADWHAKWISAEGASLAGAKTEVYETLLLRREFAVKPKLKRAVVHVCGLGQYEITFNGRKVSNDLLSPGWTNYRKACLYDTYDVTAMLRPGANAAGIFLGNGMYNVVGGRYTKFTGSFGPQKAIAQLRLEYGDGSVETVGTDGKWRVAPGPVTFSCVFGGEDYDARLEQAGWDQPGFKDSAWAPALETKTPGGALRGVTEAAPPIRAFDVLKPVAARQLRPGLTVYDLGQNVSLMPRITVKGPVGASVKITPSELVHGDGSINDTVCGGQSFYTYKLSGKDSETWFPKFFYRGGRYLQVELSSPTGMALPTVESIEGVVVHSSAAPVGEFSCSNELFNRIRTLIRWAQRSNMMSVITDCPHREKLGWLEQYHLHGPSLRYEWDMATLYAKGVNDMAEAQRPNGLVPDIAPEYTVFSDGFVDSPEWGGSYIIVPWQQYEWTGDIELLRKHFDGMKRYVDYLTTRSRDHIVSHGLGDWYDIGPGDPGYAQLTPTSVTATAYYYTDAEIVGRTARLLGRTEDAEKYGKLAAEIRNTFNKKFYDPATGKFATGSQCANAIALAMNIAEPSTRQAALDVIVRDVRSRANSLTAGDIGFHYLLRALADGGRSDVIFDMNNQSEKPGYGYQLQLGATSLTEGWAGQSSQNHFMLGHIIEWFYSGLAGIRQAPDSVAFGKIVLDPNPVGDIRWVKASYESVQGRIVCDWEIKDGDFVLAASIPPNTTGEIHVPARESPQVTEGSTPAEKAPGVRFLRMERGKAVYQVVSGSYRFRSEGPFSDGSRTSRETAIPMRIDSPSLE